MLTTFRVVIEFQSEGEVWNHFYKTTALSPEIAILRVSDLVPRNLKKSVVSVIVEKMPVRTLEVKR